MVKNKKVKPIIIMIIVSSIIIIGLIAFNKIYDVIANIELYYIESTTELPLEYKSLFTEDGEKKIGKLMTFAYPNSKKRNKISILEIENNYEVLIYKLSNSDKKIINLYTGICSDIPLQGSIYNKLRSQNCEFNFKGEVDSSWNNGIVATYSGDDSVHYFCKNDSIIILSIDCDKFALKDPKASSADILIKPKNTVFDAKRPMLFCYLNRDESIYFIFMSPKNIKDSFSQDIRWQKYFKIHLAPV